MWCVTKEHTCSASRRFKTVSQTLLVSHPGKFCPERRRTRHLGRNPELDSCLRRRGPGSALRVMRVWLHLRHRGARTGCPAVSSAHGQHAKQALTSLGCSHRKVWGEQDEATEQIIQSSPRLRARGSAQWCDVPLAAQERAGNAAHPGDGHPSTNSKIRVDLRQTNQPIPNKVTVKTHRWSLQETQQDKTADLSEI